MKMVSLDTSRNHCKFTGAPANRASTARRHSRKLELIKEVQFTVQNVKINTRSSPLQQLPLDAQNWKYRHRKN